MLHRRLKAMCLLITAKFGTIWKATVARYR
jgi:hypothetical protein